MQVTLDAPWLEVDLGAPHRVLSWSLNRPGLVEARYLLWREVRDADLTAELDVGAWLAAELAARGWQDRVAMLTSRSLASHHLARVEVEGVRAEAVATVGLSNAERVGARQPADAASWGTINVAVQVAAPLSDGARIEALSLVAEARSAAVIEAAVPLAGGVATGTGTDCIAVASPAGELAYAGKHTAAGEAVGRAAYQALRAGVAAWVAELG